MSGLGNTEIKLDRFKRTKVIATVGPATNSFESIIKMVEVGANGFRLNFSHGTYEERDSQIRWIRDAARKHAKPVAIIQDLQGPKIRLGDFMGIINVSSGQELIFEYQPDADKKTTHIPIQYDLSKKIKRGDRMFINEGSIRAVVTSANGGYVHATASNDGVMVQRKGINVPDTDFAGDVITDKDKQDILYGAGKDIDYVAMSFVQSAEDIVSLRKILRNAGSGARIIAKIETKSATKDLKNIVKEADVVMVARGDLATETTAETVPILQRKIIGLGLEYATPTIVATHMLASMVDSKEPTRAEVSDVATAVIVGADAVMLSDETAIGKHPVEAVKIMKKVILYTQDHMPLKAVFEKDDKVLFDDSQTAISGAVIDLANKVKAKAIVAETKSGATALKIASHRIETPLVAVTSTQRVAQALAIVYGIKSYVRPDDKFQATKLTNWLHSNKVLEKGDIVVTASGKHPGVVGTTDTIKIRVL